jgi:predicted nucleic acid-binding protein
MMEVYTSVMKTTNYDMFKFMEGNRAINSTNLKQIIESMKEKQLIIPITVNEKFEVIDGQHRLSACKYLGLPVYFIIEKGYDIEDVIRANVNGGRKWYDVDYLNKYCLLKDDRYLEVRKLTLDFDITINDFIKILSIIQNKKTTVVKREFREGKISLDGISVLISFLVSLETFKTFKLYKRGNFIVAFSKLFFREDYDHNYMVKKYKTYYPNLTKQTSVDEYLSVLCNKIYSYGTTKNPIYYSSESKKFHQ